MLNTNIIGPILDNIRCWPAKMANQNVIVGVPGTDGNIEVVRKVLSLIWRLYVSASGGGQAAGCGVKPKTDLQIYIWIFYGSIFVCYALKWDQLILVHPPLGTPTWLPTTGQPPFPIQESGTKYHAVCGQSDLQIWYLNFLWINIGLLAPLAVLLE